MPASGVASSDLFLVIDVDNPDINERSQKFTASGLMDYVYQRLSVEGQDQRFYADVANSTQRGFFGTIGVNTISGNTADGGTTVNIASGVTLNFSNFQNQNLIEQNTAAPTDSGVILWYRPPVSGLLGRTYYRYINPTGVGPSAIEWVEASPFEATTIQIGTQQVISGIFNPLRIPAATNNPSGYGGIRYTDIEGHILNASGVFTTVPLVTSGYVGAVPSISGVQEGLPLIKQGDTVIYATLSGSSINTDFSSSQVRFAQGTQAEPSITFTGDLNTGLYSPAADQVGITVSGFEHFRVARNIVTVSGALNINDGVLATEQDIVINGIEAGRGGGNIATNTRFGDVALDGNTTGAGNTAIGKDSLANNQAGSSNTAVGYQAAFNVVNGGNSSAFGAYALYSAANNNSNTALGYSALYDVVTGDGNTAVGAYSLGNTTASNNVGVGYEAGLNNVGGSSNTLIGYTAGRDLTTGSNNTIIGRVPASAGVADTIIIAAGTAEKIKVDSSNNVFLNGTIKTISGGTGAVPIYTTSGDPDTGVFFPSANTVGISASGLGQLAVDINRVTVSGTFLANTVSGTTYAATLGSITAPTYSFSGDLNTGIYSPAADRVGITVSGLGRVAVDINRTTVSGTFYADTISGTTYAATLGTAAAPTYSFSGDLNTGLYSPAADRVGISVSGVGRVAVDVNRTTVSGTFYADTVSGSVVTAGLGSEGTPSISFSGDLNTGIFSPGADVLGLSASGLGIMEVRSSGVFVSGLIYEAPTGVNYYPVVTQLDIGTDDNQIPLNGYLGSMAFQDEDDIAVGVGTFEVINVSGINVIETISGTRFVATSGTAAAPAFTFSGDLDTGFFNPAPNTAALSVSGLGRVAIDINRTTVSGTFYADTISGTTYSATLGSIAAPTYSFSGDLNTGIYSPAADRVGITVSGLGRLAVDINRTTVSGTFYADTVSGNVHTAGLGTAAAPGFSFSGDLNTGIFSPGADVLAISSSGLSIVEVRSSGVYVSGLIYEMSSGTTYYPVVTQYDVGTALNQIPLNTYLGSMAYQDENDIVVGNGTFDSITVSGIQVYNTVSGTNFVATSGTAALPSYTFSGDLNTGIYSPAADQVGVSVSGLGRVAVDINRTTVSGTFYADTISGTTYAATLGSVTAPTYSFSGDLNTGIYSPASDRVGITVSGLGRLAVDINRTTVSGTFYADTVSGNVLTAGLGTATAPGFSFSGDLNTGIYSPAADRIGVSVSGLGRVAIDINRTTVSGTFYADTVSGNVLTAGLGTATAPAFSFSGDLNTGVFSPSADTLALAASGLNIMEVRSSGVFISGLIYEAPTGVNYYPVVTQLDIGTAPNQIPINSYLGSMAFQDADAINVDIGLFDSISVSGIQVFNTISGSTFVATSGTASAPSFTFSGDLNTGIYSSAPDQVAIAASGLQYLRVSPNTVTTSGNVNVNGGTLTTEQDIVVNGVEIGRGGGSLISNVRVGDQALQANTTGASNVAIGKDSLVLNDGGSDNIAIGYQALRLNVNGGNNTAIGGYSLYSATSPNGITAIGYAALYDFVSGSDNVAIGAYSLPNTVNQYNVAVGTNTGYNNVSGIYNTLIGHNAGYNLTNGNSNTIIGSIQGTAGLANTIIIGAGAAEKIKVDSNNDFYLSGTIKPTISGTNAAPLYTTSGDPDTGILFSAANTINLSASGLGRVAVDINRTTVSGTFYADTISGTTYAATLGSITAPTYSFSGDLNTGIYSPAADRVGITVSGLGRVAVDINRTTVSGTFYADTVSGNVHTAGLGTAAAPGFSFSGDLNTGIFSPSADTMAFSSSGLNIMEVRSSGIFISGLIYEAPTGVNYYPVVTQLDIGTDDNQIPLNGYLGSMAFQDEDDIAVGNGTFEYITASGVTILANGNIKIGGTADRATTSGTNQLVLFDGTAPVGTLTSGVSLYSTAGGLYSMDATGLSTQISPNITTSGTISGASFIPTNSGIPSNGLYRSGNNSISLATNTAERLKIDGFGRFFLGGSSSFVSDAFGGVRGFHMTNFSTYTSIGTHRNDNTEFGSAYIFTKARGTGFEALTSEDTIGLVAFHGANGSAFNQAAEIRCVVDGAVTGGGSNDMPGRLDFFTTPDGSGTPSLRMRIDKAGNIKVGGTADRSGTAGTNQLVIFDGTAPVGTLANGVSFYSTAGECRVMDSAGNATLLSPHNPENNEWIYDSVDTRTGKRLRVDMEKLVKFIDSYFGTNFVQESFAID